jgi:hypothetical protein
MALPSNYLEYLKARRVDKDTINYLDANYGPDFGNMDVLDNELYNSYGIHPTEIQDFTDSYTRKPSSSTRQAFRLSANPKAQAKFTEEQVDNAVLHGYNPEIFTNYGKPGNDDRRADTAMSMLGKNSRNDRALSTDPKLDVNKLEPMTAEESIEGLRQAGTNAYRDAKETGGYYLQQADEATKPIRQAISSTAAPVIHAVSSTAGPMVQKAKQYAEPIYKEYVEQPIQREYQRQKDTYNTLAADPEATLEGAKMMARDAGEYVRDTAHTIRNESPSWVARFSKTLSEGSNFGKELKDAWNDPDYYLAGGRYENKGYESKQPVAPTQRYEDRVRQRIESAPTVNTYTTPDSSKLPSAGSVAVKPPAAPATQTTKQSGFSLYNNNSVQLPRSSVKTSWTNI